MSIIPVLRTHAQNRHYRRILNRDFPHHNEKGTPIPGELTPTEIAHKARRHHNRLSLLKSRIYDLLASIERDETIKRNNEKFNTKEAHAVIKACEYSLRQYREQLSLAQRSLTRLNDGI